VRLPCTDSGGRRREMTGKLPGLEATSGWLRNSPTWWRRRPGSSQPCDDPAANRVQNRRHSVRSRAATVVPNLAPARARQGFVGLADLATEHLAVTGSASRQAPTGAASQNGIMLFYMALSWDLLGVSATRYTGS